MNLEQVYNWLLKQVFYFRYFVLGIGKQGLDLIPSDCEFYSTSFDDLQWQPHLPWSDGKLIEWNTYGVYSNVEQKRHYEFTQQYGKFYFLTTLDGLITRRQWPALWLLEIGDGNSTYYEIDIELFKKKFGFTIWWNDNGYQDKGEISRAMFENSTLYRDLQKRQHLFLIDWSEEYIKFYIDGILTAIFENHIHIPMHMIISKSSMAKVCVTK